MKTVSVIIPALNEESSVGGVVGEIPREKIREIVVVNNGSTDGTAEAARAAGATVIDEPARGYGRACLAGIRHISQDPPETVVFLDADYSDYPSEMPLLTAPIEADGADLVLGSRITGARSSGAMPPHTVFGNKVAGVLLSALFGVKFTDLGPFRAIRFSSLMSLDMRDEDYGWTVEMQIKAVKKGLRCVEIPVRYRKRTGVSKISGTFSGSAKAGVKIARVIARHVFG
ncbi:MAG: glycosyltransferase family 2 protein [Candidatus Dadabacteria bacterium]|nr:glycosyltransferase family 2 protein [Candidatus Dadabacteria bacterium]